MTRIIRRALASARWVLVVDDDRPTWQLFELVLQEMHLVSRMASDVVEAERVLGVMPHPPSLVILDVRLSGGEDIHDFVTRLEDRFGRLIPVLVVSGLDAPRLAALADEVGAYAFVCKPFEIDEFMRVVRLGLDVDYGNEEHGASLA